MLNMSHRKLVQHFDLHSAMQEQQKKENALRTSVGYKFIILNKRNARNSTPPPLFLFFRGETYQGALRLTLD